MKNTLHFFLTITFLLTGILSFAGKKTNNDLACPTATINYIGNPFCSSNTSPQEVTLTGTDAYLGGIYSAMPFGLNINPTTGEIIPSTSTPGTYTVTYTILASGSCGSVSTTTTITISPSNTVSAPSSTPTLCINTTLTPITHTVTGATGMGTPTGLPMATTASWSGNTITITGSPIAAGVFNYSIPLTGGCGTTYATGTITVLPGPGNPTIYGTTTTCAGTPVSLTVIGNPEVVFTMTDGSASFTYTIGSSGSISIPVSPTVNTTYTLTSASLNTCSTSVSGPESSATVTVNPTPQFVNEIPDMIICNGGYLGLSGFLNSTVPGTTFNWTSQTTNINFPILNGDQTNIDQFPNNLINSSQGGYITIMITPQIGNCTGNPQQVSVMVNPIPSITTITENNNSICNNQFATITANSNSATEYYWQVNTANGVQIVDGVTSGTSATGIINVQLALINSLMSGTISFMITPVNGNCIGATNSVTITVNPTPGSPIGLPTFNICSGETPNLYIAAYPNIAGTIFEWEIIPSANVTVDIVTPSGSSFPFTIDDILTNTSNVAESVTYSVTTKLGDCEGGTTNYVVNVLPLPDLSILIDGEITIDSDGNLTPYVLDTGLDTFNHTFEWYLNGTLISSANSNTFTASEEGEYSVHVTSVVTNCSNFANAFVTETTIENEEVTDLVMYPNPTLDSLSFNNINKVMSVQISNQMGQTILYKDLNSKTGTIDLSDLNVGIYNIVFETESGTVNQRIIKQ